MEESRMESLGVKAESDLTRVQTLGVEVVGIDEVCE
jgi:hypothetical protein